MSPRVARVRREQTGWELARRLKEACPAGPRFVLVLARPGEGYEVTPDGPFHPADRRRAAEVVREFKASRAAD